MKKPFEVLHEDDAFVVVNKAPFTLTIPDRYAPEKYNLYHELKKKYGEIYTVHRLDKETSGILIFGRTEEAHKNLSQQFQKRTVEKIYLTLVSGAMHEMEGVIDKPLAPHQHLQDRMVVTKHGKPSVTNFKVIELFKNFSLVEAEIKTGRTHQIRVHFQSMGYPLAVDAIYGKKEAFYLSEIKLRKFRMGKDQEERPLMTRSALHAFRLTFDHPSTGEQMVFEAPLPKDFKAVVQQLRKWGK